LFVLLYAAVHGEAVTGEIRAVRWVQDVQPVLGEPDRRAAAEHVFRPEGYRRVYGLNSPLLNSRTDYYEPVRFSHIAHDVLTGGDCGRCHHRFSFDEEDRAGYTLEGLHAEFEVRIGGPCGSCHDMEYVSIQPCAACHRLPNEPDDPGRPGLKGAYHRLCIGCHAEQTVQGLAPTDCSSCHHAHVPDHRVLLALDGRPRPEEATRRCLECHETVGDDILKTAHWNWRGHSARVCDHEHRVDLGLQTLVNNHFIGARPNLPYCARCHIGFGFRGDELVVDDPATIDCFICHDTTGTYRKMPAGGGAPDPSVDLLHVAERVGRPSRGNCGACHFHCGSGVNVKHGDLEPLLTDPPDDFDVHMGRHDMRCQDCHTTTRHRIAGMSLSAPAVEGRVTCERCHGDAPHGISGPLSRHLDDHVESVACETCHIPHVAKELPTRVFIDYERAGELGPVPVDLHGQPVYPPGSGVERWVSDLVPTHRWHDDTREAYVLGDTIDPSGTVVLNEPRGERHDPAARIRPFKVHEAIQPYDTGRNVLLVPKLWEGFWKHFDMGRAIVEGMEAVGEEYSGEYGFVRTAMYTGLHHQVPPADRSLGCADCHRAEAVGCARCHEGLTGFEPPAHAGALYPDDGPRLDFEELGYPDDPALVGGRFRLSIGPGRPVR
jgi:octaheme c-type cytochrome (tetrathionate reductase family)